MNLSKIIVAENPIVEFEVTTPSDVEGKIYCAFCVFVAESYVCVRICTCVCMQLAKNPILLL